MVWVKLDENFVDHPKIAALGNLSVPGGWLHVAALCYCNRHLTDGFIHRGVIPKLVCLDGLCLKNAHRMPREVTVNDVVSALVSVGLWEPEATGFRIHDYLEYQPSRAEHLANLEAKKRAGQAGGQASAKARAQAGAKASAQANGKQVLNGISTDGPTDFQAESNPAPVSVSEEEIKKEEERKKRAALVDNLTPTENVRRRGNVKAEPESIGALIAQAAITPPSDDFGDIDWGDDPPVSASSGPPQTPSGEARPEVSSGREGGTPLSTLRDEPNGALSTRKPQSDLQGEKVQPSGAGQTP